MGDAVVAIETEEQFRAWLEKQSQQTCIWIAFRAAMRVVPFVTRVETRERVSGLLCTADWVHAS